MAAGCVYCKEMHFFPCLFLSLLLNLPLHKAGRRPIAGQCRAGFHPTQDAQVGKVWVWLFFLFFFFLQRTQGGKKTLFSIFRKESYNFRASWLNCKTYLGYI